MAHLSCDVVIGDSLVCLKAVFGFSLLIKFLKCGKTNEIRQPGFWRIEKNVFSILMYKSYVSIEKIFVY